MWLSIAVIHDRVGRPRSRAAPAAASISARPTPRRARLRVDVQVVEHGDVLGRDRVLGPVDAGEPDHVVALARLEQDPGLAAGEAREERAVAGIVGLGDAVEALVAGHQRQHRLEPGAVDAGDLHAVIRSAPGVARCRRCWLNRGHACSSHAGRPGRRRAGRPREDNWREHVRPRAEGDRRGDRRHRPRSEPCLDRAPSPTRPDHRRRARRRHRRAARLRRGRPDQRARARERRRRRRGARRSARHRPARRPLHGLDRTALDHPDPGASSSRKAGRRCASASTRTARLRGCSTSSGCATCSRAADRRTASAPVGSWRTRDPDTSE